MINPDICKRNLQIMAEKASSSGVIFRPHFKTHQSLILGRWYKDAGISKITVSSLSAAEYFANDGWKDITVAFPVNLREIDLINQLAKTVRIGLLLENPQVAIALDCELKYNADVYIKIDTGYHRTGLMPGEMPVIKDLADRVQNSNHLNLAGLLTHAGHTYHAPNAAAIKNIYAESTRILNDVKNNLSYLGQDLILSYGDTPSCTLMESFENIQEIRPGNFIFYDLMMIDAGVCDPSQVGGIVVCPVVATHPSRNQAVLYGGAIHFSKDSILIDGKRGYGQMVEMNAKGWHKPIPGAWLVSLSQEHGILEAPPEVIMNLKPGSVVGILPVHACLTANLLHGYQLTDGGIADYFIGN